MKRTSRIFAVIVAILLAVTVLFLTQATVFAAKSGTGSCPGGGRGAMMSRGMMGGQGSGANCAKMSQNMSKYCTERMKEKNGKCQTNSKQCATGKKGSRQGVCGQGAQNCSGHAAQTTSK